MGLKPLASVAASSLLLLSLLSVPAAAATVVFTPNIRASSSTNSLNWAGYALSAPAGSVTTVSGSFVQPSVSDVISVTVACSPVTGGATCTATVTDSSKGDSYSNSATVSGAQLADAECIAERPAVAGSLMTLANFGVARTAKAIPAPQARAAPTRRPSVPSQAPPR